MESFRLFLHVLSASIWVGGQIALGALVPTLKEIGNDAPKKAAQAFNRIAWPAFGVLVFTGLWNLMTVFTADEQPENFNFWFGIKFLAVLVSGGGAALHIMGTSKKALAIGGAGSSLGSIVAMYLGFVI